MKINLSQSKAPFQSRSMIGQSNTEALQYKRQIECNRITNDNQNINKTNEKHVKDHRSSRTAEDGRSLRAEQLNIRFLLYESSFVFFIYTPFVRVLARAQATQPTRFFNNVIYKMP